MPGATNTLLIEGSFEELCDEFAVYLDGLNNAQGNQTSLQSEVQQSLQGGNKDEVLKKIVGASAVLNSAPEREIIAAYNLLVHLVRQSSDPNIFLNRICSYLEKPITSSTNNSAGIALNILTTIFNSLSSEQEARYYVLLTILKVVRSQNSFEQIKPQLRNLDAWLEEWEMEKKESRTLYLAISDVASESSATEDSYQYLLKALRTTQDGSDASSPEAKELTIRAITTALNNPSQYDFQDLTTLDSVHALHSSEPNWFELLEIFAAQSLDDYADFQEANPSFVSESHNLDEAVLERKMRLLTLSTLAAGASQTRSLPYAQIAKALRVPAEDVEMWVIDVIRAGLVEGKLSQSTQTFLIHRATYRTFGENQWREVSARLSMWRESLTGVLKVVREQKEQFVRDKEQELRDAEQAASGKGYRPNRQYRNAVEVE